jgi:SNF2 family DNA or RNA helicase
MGSISFTLGQGDTVVHIHREEGVSEATWLQVRAEAETGGRNVSSELVVSLERFLARRAALSRISKGAGIKLRLDDRLREVVLCANQDQSRLLTAANDEPAPLRPDELAARLEGGRFQRELRTFQSRDLSHLLSLSHGANFSVPGAGKTTVALATYEAERMSGRVERILVIAPLSAFGSWEEEAKRSFSEALAVHRFDGSVIPPDTELVLVNYHRLSTGYDQLAAWVVEKPTQVVLDEAHRMKRGWDGQWGTACLNLAYLAQRRDVLTGTPAPQGPRDFIALIDYLWPGMARRVLPSDALVHQPPPGAGARVADAIRPLFARTTKHELHLPEVEFDPLVVPLTGLQRDIYLSLRDRYAGGLSVSLAVRHDFLAMGRVVMYLLEAASNPKLLTAGSLDGADPDIFRHPPLTIPEGSELGDLLRRYNEFETPAKFQTLARLVKDNAEKGRKTLIWSNFVRNLELLKGMLSTYRPALIHGRVPQVAPAGQVSRETEIARFRQDPECLVLLANPAAMSEGISLHRECHDAIYLDRTFNAGQYLQSVDRIHRLGLDPDTETRITFLITDETIDQTVDERVREKAVRLGEMLDDPNLASVSLPNEEDYGAPIDDDLDLGTLLRHLRQDDA